MDDRWNDSWRNDNSSSNGNQDSGNGSGDSSQDESSVYSYSYRNQDESSATHGGDYDARRDDPGRYSSGSSQSGSNSSYGTGSYQSGQNSSSYGSGYQNTGSYSNGQNSGNYGGGYQNNGNYGDNYQNTGSYYQSSGNSNGSDGGRKNRKRNSRPKRDRSRRNGSGFWKKKNFGVAILKCVILAAAFGFVAGGIFYGVSGIRNYSSEDEDGETASTTSSTDVDSTSVSSAVTVTDVSDIVENVMPSIVSITNVSETAYYDMFGSGSEETYESESAGSGIIVAEDDDYLYVATNNHVVEDYTYLTVTFCDDSTANAEVKGTASSSDLAVVSVAKTELESDTLSEILIATLGDSTTLKVGESAIAIGNALGYGQSVTTGVISALDREVTTTDSDGNSVTNTLIQTDAAINPGNSGGALLNMNGEVIGINSVKYSDTDVEGMGYAIPISTAQPIINDLIEQEKVDESESAYLGISGVDVDSDTASTYSMPQGVYIVQVIEGSAAETAGLQQGDIITEFDGYTISSMEELQERLEYYAAGEEVEIIIQRNSNGSYEEMTISVTLGSKN